MQCVIQVILFVFVIIAAQTLLLVLVVLWAYNFLSLAATYSCYRVPPLLSFVLPSIIFRCFYEPFLVLGYTEFHTLWIILEILYSWRGNLFFKASRVCNLHCTYIPMYLFVMCYCQLRLPYFRYSPSIVDSKSFIKWKRSIQTKEKHPLKLCIYWQTAHSVPGTL